MGILTGFDMEGGLPYAQDDENNPRYRFSVGVRELNIWERLSYMLTNILRFIFTYDEGVRLVGIYEGRMWDVLEKRMVWRRKIDENVREEFTLGLDTPYERKISDFEISSGGRKVIIRAHRCIEYDNDEVGGLGGKLQKMPDLEINVDFDELSVDVRGFEGGLISIMRGIR